MGTVRMLPDDLINKIAAGEVVDRPASAVKELVENSIDAGSTRIDIDIERGGKGLICITDNGCGMTEEDARMALQRHATSKIREEKDLFRIMTMGFRGEALPSIASVSRFMLTTRVETEPVGTQIRVDGGNQDVQGTARAPGTTVEIKELFFNVPGRRKFLKTDGTEFTHILETISRLAMAHPEIYFRLNHNGRMQLQASPTTDLRERVSALLGRSVGDAMYPVSYQTHWLKIHGLFSEPTQSTKSTQGLYLFVNGRFVRDRGLAHACQEAYRGTIEKGRYPHVVLFLELDPTEIDVNVHPQKIEVRFQRQHDIYSRLLITLRNAIAQAPWLQKTLSPAKTSAVSSTTTVAAMPETPGDGSAHPPDLSFDASDFSPLEPPVISANRSVASVHSSHTPTSLSHPPHPPAAQDFPTAWQPQTTEPSRNHTHTGETVTAPTSNTTKAPQNFAEFRERFLRAAEKQHLVVTPTVPAVKETLPPLPSVQKGLPFLPGWDTTPEAAVSTPNPPVTPAGSQVHTSTTPVSPISVSSVPSASKESRRFFSHLRYIGQFANMYLLFELHNKLFLIDQHAAHERITYQRLLADYEREHMPQQPYLLPPRLELSLTEAQQVDLYREDLERLGLHLEPFGGQSYVLQAVPVHLKHADPYALLRDILEELAAGKRTATLDEKRDEILMRMACHSSVRGPHLLSAEEVRALLQQMDEIDFSTHCPHGRPVMIEFTQQELEKRFHRT